MTVAFALGAVVYGTITEGVLAFIRWWHGSIDEQFILSHFSAFKQQYGYAPTAE
jgi:hypothetical protein